MEPYNIETSTVKANDGNPLPVICAGHGPGQPLDGDDTEVCWPSSIFHKFQLEVALALAVFEVFHILWGHPYSFSDVLTRAVFHLQKILRYGIVAH